MKTAAFVAAAVATLAATHDVRAQSSAPDGAAPPVVYDPGPVPRPVRLRRRVTPYEGGALPPGSHLEQRPYTAIAVAGAVVWGVTWLPAALGSLLVFQDPGGAFMLLPGPGPALWLAIDANDTRGGSLPGLLIADSALQCAGLAGFIVGTVVHHPVVVTEYWGARRGPEFALLPGSGARAPGVSLAVTGW